MSTCRRIERSITVYDVLEDLLLLRLAVVQLLHRAELRRLHKQSEARQNDHRMDQRSTWTQAADKAVSRHSHKAYGAQYLLTTNKRVTDLGSAVDSCLDEVAGEAGEDAQLLIRQIDRLHTA